MHWENCVLLEAYLLFLLSPGSNDKIIFYFYFNTEYSRVKIIGFYVPIPEYDPGSVQNAYYHEHYNLSILLLCCSFLRAKKIAYFKYGSFYQSSQGVHCF